VNHDSGEQPSGLPANAITHCIGLHLAMLMRAHRHCAEAALKTMGLYAGQEIILFQLWQQDGLTQTQIASALEVEPPTVTKMLHRMVTAGLVERRADPADARLSRVYLTDKGRALESSVTDIWQHLESTFTSGLSDVELALLRRLVTHMRTNLESC
jgi:DNA-binding MarR family transcriptional regulator